MGVIKLIRQFNSNRMNHIMNDTLYQSTLQRESNPKGKGPIPGFCCLGITDYCFFKCKMCDKWKEDIKVKEKVQPTMAQYKQFLTDLRGMFGPDCKDAYEDHFLVNIAGGEAITHPFTIPLIKFCTELGFNTTLVSNGWLLDDKKLKKLSEAGLTNLNLSLDSLDESIHDEVRGQKGSAKKVLEVIDNMRRYRNVKVGTISILHDKTVDGILDIMHWGMQHDVLQMNYIMAIMQPNNTSFDGGWYNSEEFDFLWPKDLKKVDDVLNHLIAMKKNNQSLLKEGYIKHDKMDNSISQLEAMKD